MNTFPRMIIFSVEQSNLDKTTNAKSTAFAEVYIKEFTKNSYMNLFGVYKNVGEHSFAVLEHYRPFVEKLCADFGQECYLELESDREACLVYPNGNREHLGKFTSVSETIAKAEEGYTWDYKNNRYYIVD